MATQAQYIAEYNNLRSQAFWDGVNSEQLKTIAALSLIGAAAGGSTSDATAANQVTGNNSLSSIDTKLGTTLAADIAAIKNNTAKISQSTSTVVTTVTATNSSVTILPANSARRGAKLVNASSAIFYGLYQTGTASPTNCSFVLAPVTGGIPGIEEVPFGYQGAISGVWASNNGNLSVTEFI
jgi:hypothetical protein